MKTVFVVINGEKHEGGDVWSVHKTHEGALESAMKVDRHFSGDWRIERENYWTNGCDFVKIVEEKLQK